MSRAVIYERISDDREGSGLGVARQDEDCRAFCERHGWAVADVLVDNDVSAYSGRPRPAYRKLLAGMEAGLWDVLVVWHPDRLHRSPRELEGFIDLVDRSGIDVETVTAGGLDLKTPTGRAVARTVAAWSRQFSEHGADKIRRKHQQIAEAGGLAGGGTRPFGYLDDRRTAHPVEGPLVREAAQSVLDGMAVRGICRDWTARGVQTVTGRPWTAHTLRRILIAPRAAGLRRHGGRCYRGVWEPLLDEVTWRRVCAVLEDPARRVNTAPRTYLLTGGLARCGLCGAALVARPRSDKRRSYVCASGPGFHGCGKIRILAEPFEEDVRRQAAQLIAEGGLDASAPNVQPHLDDLERIREAMAELATDYYTDRAISKAQFQAASASLSQQETALVSLVATIERRRPVSLGAAAVAELAGAEPTMRRRAIVEAVFDRIDVGPGVRGRNFYDRDRVAVTPRD